MPYVKLSREETEQIREKEKTTPDRLGMTWYEALEIAQAIWGTKGYVAAKRTFTMKDPVGYDGYVIPTGYLYGYDVGYERKGKKGSTLHTSWEGETYVEAFLSMLKDYTDKRVKNLEKIKSILTTYGIYGYRR